MNWLREKNCLIDINVSSLYNQNDVYENLIKESLSKLEDVLNNVGNMPVDMLAIDIKVAWDLLGEITGESYQDELIDILFKNFCLGK